MKKIAFLFLIYDKILQEKLWHNFFRNIDQKKYSIYIHYKENADLLFFNNYKLPNCIKTNHGGISIVNAMRLLLDEAYKDESNYKFIYLSQSCIPLKNFDHVYNHLTYNNFSIFNEAFGNDQIFPRCNPVLEFLDKEKVFKSSMWFILNRNHANLILKDNEYINYFKEIFASDEHYFISLAKNKGSKNDLVCLPNLSNGAPTFTNWPLHKGIAYPEKYISNIDYIKTYSTISEEELNFLIESPCFFGRKFSEKCSVSNTPICEYLTNKIKF